MDNENKYIDSQRIDHRIQNRKRGEILYYSINQVANLLKENIGNIKYYTNVFDDLLKIEIVDKELRYNNNDINKLELLIKLKNKGMSLKEIEDYYNKLPLNDTEIQHPESNLLSVEELIDSVKEAQQIQFNNFKVQLINDIQNINALYLEKICSTVIETQKESLNEFKQDLFKEIKEYINSKFENANETNINLQNDLNNFVETALANNERLIQEVKDFKRVIQDSYYIQQEVERENSNSSFLGKLLQTMKFK
jgi:DNA-binding transcriptional MerR regulator